MTARLTGLLASASVEVSSNGSQLKELSDQFAADTNVSITFLPGDNYRHNVETAARCSTISWCGRGVRPMYAASS